MAGGPAGSRLRGWRDAAVRELSRPDALRLLVGPGSSLTLVGLDGVRALPGVNASEVTAWMDELVPRPREEKRDAGSLRRHPLPNGDGLWVQRHSSPEGDWLSASLAARRLPEWNELGLAEPLFDELQASDRGTTLLLASDPDGPDAVAWPGMAALAAWLARRAAKRPEVAWIVETMPRYDWSALPGRVRSVAPSRLRRPGALEELCRASGASLLALAESPDGVLAEALRMAELGLRLVLLSPRTDAEARARAVRRSFGPEAPSGNEPDLPPASIWEVTGAAPPKRVPLASRVVVPADRG
jgi:hypothetical protein